MKSYETQFKKFATVLGHFNALTVPVVTSFLPQIDPKRLNVM